MKKLFSFFIIILLSAFFLMPIPCRTLGSANVSYRFVTTIYQWNHEDELVFHPSESEYLQSVLIYYGDQSIDCTGGCSLQEMDFGDYEESIQVEELFHAENYISSTITITPGYLTIDSDFDNTPIFDYIFQGYHPDEFTTDVDLTGTEPIDPDGSTRLEYIAPSNLSPVDVTEEVDSGDVMFPYFFVEYQFITRGDLADPSGTFLFYNPGEEEPLSFTNHETYVTQGDTSLIRSLADLKSFLESKPEVVYSGVYNEQDYGVNFINLNGSGLESVVQNSNGNWGYVFEVEARNDSEIANTGLLYDIGPYLLLGIVFIGFLVIFKKHKIKDENEEIMEELH